MPPLAGAGVRKAVFCLAFSGKGGQKGLCIFTMAYAVLEVYPQIKHCVFCRKKAGLANFWLSGIMRSLVCSNIPAQRIGVFRKSPCPVSLGAGLCGLQGRHAFSLDKAGGEDRPVPSKDRSLVSLFPVSQRKWREYKA